MSAYDVLVVGTGAAGTTAAERCAGAGRRVAIVDRLPYGGTCLLRGCDPKKVLVGAAEAVDWVRRMAGSGIAGESHIDWPELMRFKHTFTDPVSPQREGELRKAGVTTYRGVASFASPSSMLIGGETVEAKNIVLACGAWPAKLGLQGEAYLIDSTGFLDLTELPKRIAFIGGGYIAFELAHLAARAGASPVILQRGPRVLTGFEPSLVDRIVAIGGEVGVDVRTNAEIVSVDKTPSGFAVSGTVSGEPLRLECDLVVNAAGRAPDLDDLALEAGNVERTRKGVTVNEFFQSRSNPTVYAVGDCADGGGLPLTPTATYEGDLAARNILEGNNHRPDFDGLASIVYTIPSLGSVGVTTAQAQAQGLRFRVAEGDSTQWYSSRRVRARCSAYRLLIGENDELLGAHVMGPHTEELINVFSLALRAKVPVSTLKATLFAYPTASSDIGAMTA